MPSLVRKKAGELRRRIVEVCAERGGHIASSLSCIEIIAELYFGGMLRHDPADPAWPGRDIFIMSKGHGELALYAVLAARGFFPEEWLRTRYRHGDCLLGGHPDRRVPGVEATTGALGHGLGIAAGHALACCKDGRDTFHFVLMGDAECTEGSIWETALFAARHELANLVGIVDRNRISACDFTEHFTALEPFARKWRSFGWEVRELDGHDVDRLHDAFDYARSARPRRPLVVIANTVKGKGVSFIENNPAWHNKSLDTPEEVALALAQVARTPE